MTSLSKELADFDPRRIDAWATFVPNRRPKFKVHSGRPQALGVLTSNNYGALFRYGPHGWVRVAIRDPAMMTACSICGDDVLSSNGHLLWWAMRINLNRDAPPLYNTGCFEWEKHNGKVVDPPRMLVLCQNCRGF
jgi:hypothetical protein